VKKIGIVTWYGGSNYGTSLQAFALTHVVGKLGAKPYLLKKCFTWRNWGGNILRSFALSSEYNRLHGYSSQKAKKIRNFKREKFNEFGRCVGLLGRFLYKSQISSMNAVISGSDQLWNPAHTEPFLMLQGLNTKKYSYASSIGVEAIPKPLIHLYKSNLSSFEQISVREITAKNILEAIINKPIRKVVDPTFLLDKNEWIAFSNSYTMLNFDTNTPYILCYFIADNSFYWDSVGMIKQKTGIQRIVVLPMQPGHFQESDETIEDAGIQDFVYLIRHSSMVCTDSFHATAISINLNKEFLTLMRFADKDVQSQNSRLSDLLRHYQLSDRLFDGKTFPLPIGEKYISVNRILENDRKDSVEYLKAIIEGC
jgi:hypothetical protein